MFDLFVYAAKEVWANKLRSILMFLSVVVATVFITSLLGTGTGIKRILFNVIDEDPSVKQIIVYSEGPQDSISEKELQEYLNLIRPISVRVIRDSGVRIEDMEKLFSLVLPSTVIVYDDSFELFTASEIKAAEVRTHRILPSYDKGQGIFVSHRVLAENRLERESVLGKTLTLNLTSEEGDRRITLPITDVIDPGLTMVMDETQYADVYLSYSLLRNSEIDYCNITSIVLDMGTHLEMDAQLEKIAGIHHSVIQNVDLLQGIENELLLYNFILTFAGAMIVIVTVVTLLNTLNVSFKERIRFHGLLKAMGYGNAYIFGLCMFQSIYICLAGSGIGIILTFFTRNQAFMYLSKILLLRKMEIGTDLFAFDSQLVISGICILIITGIIAGLFPAIISLRLNPIQALMREK